MGVFKKPDGKWVIQFMHRGKTYTCYSPDGTKKGFEKKADAKEYESHFRDQVMLSLGVKKQLSSFLFFVPSDDACRITGPCRQARPAAGPISALYRSLAALRRR